MSQPERPLKIFGVTFDKTLSIVTAINLLIMVITISSTFAIGLSEISTVREELEVQKQHQNQTRQMLRQNYLDREQIDFIILQRIDRMEENLTRKINSMDGY